MRLYVVLSILTFLFISTVNTAHAGATSIYLQLSPYGAANSMEIPQNYFGNYATPFLANQSSTVLSGNLGIELTTLNESGSLFIGLALEVGLMGKELEESISEAYYEVHNPDNQESEPVQMTTKLKAHNIYAPLSALFIIGGNIMDEGGLSIIAKSGLTFLMVLDSELYIEQQISPDNYQFEDYEVGSPNFRDARTRVVSGDSYFYENSVLMGELGLELRSNLGFPELRSNGFDLRLGASGMFGITESREEFDYTAQIFEVYVGFGVTL